METDWRPVRVELGRAGAGWVDVHPVRFDGEGNGVQDGLDDTEYRYPAAVYTTGRVGGETVGCITAALQWQVHQGYDLRPQDDHDLALLAGLVSKDPKADPPPGAPPDLGALHPS